jgi:ADP-ribose pyrophosphatase
LSELVSSRVIYSGKVLSLRLDEVVSPSGKISLREVVEHNGAVAVVALSADGEVLLVKQHRHATGRDLLEIPAGGIDPGETPEQTVLREMQEETGFLPGFIQRLGGFYSAPGFSNEYLHIFLAENLLPARLFAEDTEEISLVKVPLAGIRDLISSGQIEDAKSIAGLLMYLNRQ